MFKKKFNTIIRCIINISIKINTYLPMIHRYLNNNIIIITYLKDSYLAKLFF